MWEPSFWQGKRVFVTGHTGFKGGWLVCWLRLLGAKVTGYALQPVTQPNLFEVARVADGIHSLEGDVRDLAALRQALHEARPDIVFHLAAQPLVRSSYADPIYTYSTNIMGTAHVLEAIRHTPSVRSAVMITSDKCYQNNEWAWGYRENEKMGGRDPYSSSKGAAELVIQGYRHSYFGPEADNRTAVASARAGNVIGGGDWSAERLVPDVLAALAKDESVLLRNPIATRPWQHVLEPLHGYLRLAQTLYEHGKDYAEAYNFGPESRNAKPVAWIVTTLHQLWGSDRRWEEDQGHKPHEDIFLKLDASKAQLKLGWQPLLELEETLTWIVEWHKAYLQNRAMRQVTEQQIHRFAARIEQAVSNDSLLFS